MQTDGVRKLPGVQELGDEFALAFSATCTDDQAVGVDGQPWRCIGIGLRGTVDGCYFACGEMDWSRPPCRLSWNCALLSTLDMGIRWMGKQQLARTDQQQLILMLKVAINYILPDPRKQRHRHDILSSQHAYLAR